MSSRTRRKPPGRGSPPDRPVLSADPTVRRSLLVLAVLASLAAADAAQTVLIPFTIAAVIAAILSPLAAALRRIRLPAFAAALLAVAIPLAAVGAGIYMLMPRVELWRYRLPLFVQSVELKLSGLLDSLSEARDIARQVQEITNGEDGRTLEVTTDQEATLSFLWDIPVVLTSLSVAAILAIFLLAVAPRQFRRLGQGKPFGARLSRAMAVSGQRLVNDIARYYRVVITVNVGLGVATWLSLTALGMPQAYLWGIVGGLVNFVPYAGPVVGTGLIAIASLISFETPLEIALPPLAYVALTTVEGYFVTPTLVGRTLTLNPLLVLLSVLFWGWLWGVAGGFLAIPLLIFMLRLASFPRALGGHPVRQPADGMFEEEAKEA